MIKLDLPPESCEERLARIKRHMSWRCWDCESIPHNYMVTNEVWLQAFPKYKDHKRREKMLMQEGLLNRKMSCGILLCLSCLQLRLAPLRLTLDCFTDAPINEPIRLGFQMGLVEAGRIL